MATKARQQEILQYKIDTLTQKALIFIQFGISNRKITKLGVLKDGFVAAKIIVDAS